MSEAGRQNGKAGSPAPGTLSALLRDLARAPTAPEGADEPTGLLPGTVVGRFELVRELGRGGFGVVWEARDRELGRSVAFKLVRTGNLRGVREERLLREADATARLSHDNVVSLYDVGRSPFGPYLVLELLRGEPLSERLARGRLPLADALRIARGVARGVAYAHAEGVVHRDLKPANVFCCADGRVKVLDFGLAHLFGRARAGGGTPAYMAPEQWREAPEDERTDVFSLGVMLFELLSGTLPFSRGKSGRSAPAPALEVPAAPELGPLLARMLQQDPVKRPRDARAVLEVLEPAVARLQSGTTPVPDTALAVRRRSRWRLPALLAVGVLTGAALVTAAGWARQRAARDERLLVAVTDVANETGEKEIDVFAALLVTSLEQSRKLRVMTQARVLDLAARSGLGPAGRVDEALGREVGRRSGANVLLVPAVRKLGGTYAVEMRAIDPVRDEHLFTVSDRSTTREGLIDLLDRLSDRARQALREDPGELARNQVRLASALTRSLEAYQHYVAGLEARYRDGLRAVALQEQLRAVELDPELAAAHWQLAAIYWAYGRRDLGEPHWQAARRHLDRMPDKERTILRMAASEDPAEAQRIARDLAGRYPDDKIALYMAAQTLPRAESEDGRAAYRRVLDLDPGFTAAAVLYGGLPGVSAEEALAVARRAVEARRGPYNLATLAHRLAEQGAGQEAVVLARESLRLNGGRSLPATADACTALRMAGADAECPGVLERLEREGLNAFERDEARSLRVTWLLFRGRVRQALALAGSGRVVNLPVLEAIGRWRRSPEAQARARSRSDVPRWLVRNDLALFGDLAGAAELDRSLRPEERAGADEEQYQALVAAAAGRTDEAVRRYRARLQECEAAGWADFTLTYLLVETLVEAGRLAEAAEVRAPWPTRLNYDEVYVASSYPRILLLRARAHEKLGRSADALREVEALLAFWKEADPDLPLVVEAREMKQRLRRP